MAAKPAAALPLPLPLPLPLALPLPLPPGAALGSRPATALAPFEYLPQSLAPFLGFAFFLFSGKLLNPNVRDTISFLLVLIGLMGGIK